MAQMKKLGFDPELILDPVSNMEKLMAADQISETAFGSVVEIFKLNEHDPGNPGFASNDTIPLYMLGLAVLLKGATVRTNGFEAIYARWKEVQEYVTVKVASNNILVANLIFGQILKEHASETGQVYQRLLLASKFPYLCKHRVPLIMEWIEVLKSEAHEAYNRYREQLRIEAFEKILQAGKKRSLRLRTAGAQGDGEFTG